MKGVSLEGQSHKKCLTEMEQTPWIGHPLFKRKVSAIGIRGIQITTAWIIKHKKASAIQLAIISSSLYFNSNQTENLTKWIV